MTLKDLIAADVAIFFNEDEFARSVVYRAPSELETTITAIVYDSLTENQNNNGVNTIVSTQNMSFATADLDIDLRGLVIIDNVEWAITRRIYRDDQMTAVELQRHELHEHTRPNLRRT